MQDKMVEIINNIDIYLCNRCFNFMEIGPPCGHKSFLFFECNVNNFQIIEYYVVGCPPSHQ
jgi:hypothetical protein